MLRRNGFLIFAIACHIIILNQTLFNNFIRNRRLQLPIAVLFFLTAGPKTGHQDEQFYLLGLHPIESHLSGDGIGNCHRRAGSRNAICKHIPRQIG